MTVTYISHPTQTAHANRIDAAVSNLRSGIGQLRESYALMQSMRDGTNYTLVETMFGLAPGDGQVLFNLVRESLELVDALDNGNPNKLQKLITRIN